MVPSAAIIPPTFGIPESENTLPPLPVGPAAPMNCDPLEVWYQAGK